MAVIYAVETYLLKGAKPMTTYRAVRVFYTPDCVTVLLEDYVFPTPLTSDAHGMAHGQIHVPTAWLDLAGIRGLDMGLAFKFVDDDNVAAYVTPCQEVHFD